MRLRFFGAAATAAAPEAADMRTVSVLRAVRLMSRVVLGAAALAACARAGEQRPEATSAVDLPRSYLYAPAAITVRAGTRVTWVNHDVFTHSVRLHEVGDSDQIMKPGDSASYTFTKPGLYHYDCIFHTQMMKGTVAVTP